MLAPIRDAGYKVHADFHEAHPDLQRPRIICSSKSACYMCNLFFRCFQVPRTQGRLYDKCTLPDWLDIPLERRSGLGVIATNLREVYTPQDCLETSRSDLAHEQSLPRRRHILNGGSLSGKLWLPASVRFHAFSMGCPTMDCSVDREAVLVLSTISRSFGSYGNAENFRFISIQRASSPRLSLEILHTYILPSRL
jgi:hypothetical protein